MAKRKISLGFKEIPENNLEGNIIYVRLSGNGIDIGSIAVSREEFKSRLYAGLKGEKETSVKKITTFFGIRNKLPYTSYKEFIDDLVECNNAEVDYSILIKEGIEAYLKLSKIKEFL